MPACRVTDGDGVDDALDVEEVDGELEGDGASLLGRSVNMPQYESWAASQEGQ